MSCSFEKIDTSEITGCHLGNLVSLTDHFDLFFVCDVDIMSHLINETPYGAYQKDTDYKIRHIQVKILFLILELVISSDALFLYFRFFFCKMEIIYTSEHFVMIKGDNVYKVD